MELLQASPRCVCIAGHPEPDGAAVCHTGDACRWTNRDKPAQRALQLTSNSSAYDTNTTNIQFTGHADRSGVHAVIQYVEQHVRNLFANANDRIVGCVAMAG